jgi:cytochrome c oxidase cbb3-type subunit III
MKRTAFRGKDRLQKQGTKISCMFLGTMIATILFTYGHIRGTAMAGDQPPAEAEMTCPYTGDAAAIAEGKKLFSRNCKVCHGANGTGGFGPNLTDIDWLYGGSDAQVFVSVSNGRPGGMPSWKSDLKDDEIWKIIAFIRSIKKY